MSLKASLFGTGSKYGGVCSLLSHPCGRLRQQLFILPPCKPFVSVEMLLVACLASDAFLIVVVVLRKQVISVHAASVILLFVRSSFI